MTGAAAARRAAVGVWVEIQRQRVAHRVWPGAFPEGWTPRTVAEAIADADLQQRMEALYEDRAFSATRDRSGRAFINEPIKWRWLTYHPHSYGIATLMRLKVKLPGGRAIALHHFLPHEEVEFHDHPWSFRTFVLRGGYIDESIDYDVPDGEYTAAQRDGAVVRDSVTAGQTRRRAAHHTHRTSCSRSTWTLVVMGAPEREWCNGHIGVADWTCRP